MRRSETSERVWRRRLLKEKPQTRPARSMNQRPELIFLKSLTRHSKDSAVCHYGLRSRRMNPEKPFVASAAVRGIQEI